MMKKIDLGGLWRMTGGGFDVTGTVPGSVYSFLLEKGLMEDPFYRDNEDAALALMEHDYTFSRTFSVQKGGKMLLRCEGLDTLCTVTLNGREVAKTKNMHRTYEWDVTAYLQDGENEISLLFASPNKYVREEHAKQPIYAMKYPLQGYYHLRKAHSMYGWDWGPRLPDAGIWRDIYLLEEVEDRIGEVRILQRHEGGKVFLTVLSSCGTAILTAPGGTVTEIPVGMEFEVENPQLWWPNGLGDQPLYTVTVSTAGDCVTKRIGLRTLKLNRKKDRWGEGLCHEVNGVEFFAMGADYIPEDNVISRVTKERTEILLRQCKICNFNTIRVWGGGWYPDDFFFDLCDEMGLVVFMDIMVACSMLPDSEQMRTEMELEVRDNLLRLRHHACMGVIAGNNEVETMFARKYREQRHLLADGVWESYLELFEGILPRVVEEVCPDIPYIPSSPTTCGHFVDPQNENYGDAHYWDVWHKNMPYMEYRKHFFRYLSEFGFQSFPGEKTVNAFTAPEDRNPFSRVMERHQRRPSDNGKILSYLSQTFRYPMTFGGLLYASQLMQATAMAYCVEHLRRHRGRCMGALYWQLNDIWPGASWSSIDYFGRYKVLQYFAKRFFRPVMISCEEVGETHTRTDVNQQRDIFPYETTATLCVHNETLEEIRGTVRWQLCAADSTILQQGTEEVCVAPMSVLNLQKLDFCKTDVERNHLFYALEVGGETVSEGSVLFTAPKHYLFENPGLTAEICGDTITVKAEKYARAVEIDSLDSDFILSDNYFDMEKGEKTVKILSGTPKTLRLRSVFDIR